MVKRYLGGVISANQIAPNSQQTTGIFNPADQLTLKNKNLWELTPSWDLFRARYFSTGKLGQISVAAQETSAHAFFFKSDGTRLYVMGEGGDDVNQYELSIAWDVTTAVYTKIFSIALQESAGKALFFKPDGTKMYVMGTSGDDVNEYNLSTAWDVGTAVYVQIFSVAAQDTTPQGLFFRPDGLKMYIIGDTNDKIHEYNLSTAWSVSTAAFANSSVSIAGQDTSASGVTFKPDGTKMYVVGSANDSIYEYSLSTPWNITTMASTRSFGLNFSGVFPGSLPADLYFNDNGTTLWVLSNNVIQQFNLSIPWNVSSITLQTPTAYFNIAFEEVTPNSIAFKSDGTQMYVMGQSGDDINAYNLSRPWDTTSAVYAQLFSVAAQETTPQAMFFKPDGTKMYVLGEVGQDINEYNLSTPWNISTAVFQSVTSIYYQGPFGETLPSGLFFKPDGTELYVIGSTTDQVQAFVMTTPWVTSTLRIKTPLNCLNITSRETTPSGIYFRPDGLKMYMVGTTGDSVYEYTLSTAWDIYNAVYVRSFSVTTQESVPSSIFFKPDGTKMYVAGTSGDDVNEYNLSTAWDISTAVYSSAFVILTQVSSVTGIFFKPDGLKMYAVSDGGDNVAEYTLSTAWNTTTATYTRTVTLAGQDTLASGVFFKPDGTIMYMLGDSTDKIYQYSLSTAWDVSTAVYVKSTATLGFTTVQSLQFSADGTKVFFLHPDLETIISYSLTVAWDISTIVIALDGNFGKYTVAAQETLPTDIFFKPDGTKMYIIGEANDSVYEYVLSTPWNVTTATLYDTFYVGEKAISAQGIFFKPDGNTMYIVDQSSDAVYEYDLSNTQF